MCARFAAQAKATASSRGRLVPVERLPVLQSIMIFRRLPDLLEYQEWGCRHG
jgi:hypothetical protein